MVRHDAHRTLVLKHNNGYVLGVASRRTEGWRFFPRVSGRSPSRKAYPTADACLPRWAHKMLGCCSFLPPDDPAA